MNDNNKNQIPLEDFFKAYLDCRKRKRNTTNALNFEINYSKKLYDLYEEVRKYRYKIGPSITFIVTRPKIREVFAADFRDRIIHHLIMQRLEPLFERDFIEDNYSCRIGKGTTYGVERLRYKIKSITNEYKEDCWIGKFDLKGFFMSINKNLLWNKLKNYININYKGPDIKYLLYLTKKVVLNSPQNNCTRKSPLSSWDKLPSEKSLFTCNPECGLPIGNLTSQCFANFYLNEFDHFVSKEFDGYYGRYVDDFYIISKSKEKILSFIEKMKDYLKTNLGLILHPKKQYIQPYYKGVKFIGSVVKKGKIRTGSTCLGNMYDAIKKFNNLEVNDENLQSLYHTLNSYFGFLSRNDSYYKRLKIWLLVDSKWKLYLWASKGVKKINLKPKYDTLNLKLNIKNYERLF